MIILAEQVTEAYGLDFNGERLGELVTAAQARMHALRLPTLEKYLAVLRDPARASAELRSLVHLLTVSETSFFRHAQQLDALIAQIRFRLAASSERVRVLSAGCASGEEPYSLAILMLERFLPAERERVELIAFDLDPNQITNAHKGCYSQWSLRTTEAGIIQRWFVRTADGFQLDAQVRNMVRFEVRNLMDPDPVFWMPSGYDMIICRNVLIYFTQETMRLVVARFSRALAANGLLFLGHSETLRGMSDDFELRESGAAFYYLKPERNTEVSRAPAANTTPPPSPPKPLRRSLTMLYHMLREERYLALQEVLNEEAKHGFTDVDSMVLTSACHLALDQVLEAEAVARQSCVHWPRDARFPLLLGIVHERQGMLPAAITAYRLAISLDAEFAGAYLLLGRALRRVGRSAEAIEPLREAVRLMPFDDDQRLTLVSGGFARDLLVRVACGELKAVES